MLLRASPTYLGVCSRFHCARLLLGACSEDARGELQKHLCTRLFFARCVLVTQQSTGQRFL